MHIFKLTISYNIYSFYILVYLAIVGNNDTFWLGALVKGAGELGLIDKRFPRRGKLES
jgi:hypothetical protein